MSISIAPLNSETGKTAILPKHFVGTATHVDKFEKLNRLGEGTYGIVYRARRKSASAEIVALKRIRMDQENEGFPVSSLREISLLRQLSHPNVLKVLEVAVGSDPQDIFLVMEYCEQDMAHLIDHVSTKYKRSVFKPSEVKCLIHQLLQGVCYLHKQFVLHRDLKLSNLLLNSSGMLKIADFGLARAFGEPKEPLTPKVVTLWYRSPELLLGDSKYTTAVDMWSIGCIFGEFIKSTPLLPGKSERHQLELICDLLGTPTTSIWPDMESYPLFPTFRFPTVLYDNVSTVFYGYSSETQRLLKSMLVYRPNSRITAAEALKHAYFQEPPLSCQPALLPTFPELRNSAVEQRDAARQNYDERKRRMQYGESRAKKADSIHETERHGFFRT